MKKLVVVLIVSAAMLVSCGSSATDGEEALELSLHATDIAYDQNELTVVAGQPVRLTLYNDGALEHDFSIMDMPYSGGEMIDDAMAGHDMAHDMSNMDELPQLHMSAQSGGNMTLEFTPSTAGRYEYFCTVEGHRAAGMVGTLVVTTR